MADDKKKGAKPAKPKDGAKAPKASAPPKPAKSAAKAEAPAGESAGGRPHAPATRPRLATHYQEKVRPALMEKFGYTSLMQAPRVQKIVLNMGVGDATQD